MKNASDLWWKILNHLITGYCTAGYEAENWKENESDDDISGHMDNVIEGGGIG